MPLYEFRNKETDEVFEKFLKMDEVESFLKNNPEYERNYSPPHMTSGRSTMKPDQGFCDLLKKIKNQNPGARINTFE